MDKQKLVKIKFPLIEAILTLPKEGKKGKIGICSNTLSSGEVLNEIDNKYRNNVCALGSLIVNRDGTERMILNSLVHPTLKYLILFSEENLTFSPSTNLLQAIQFGFEDGKNGNYIRNGIAASPQYPNLSKNVIDTFKKEIIVLPLFMYKNNYSKSIVDGYLKWLKPQISGQLLEAIIEVNKKDKIYYNSLNKIIEIINKETQKEKNIQALNIDDFKNLQPPKINLQDEKKVFEVSFLVTPENNQIRLDFRLGNKNYFIKGDRDFIIGYSLMKFLKDKKNVFTSLEQILLGMELGRVSSEISNNLLYPSFVKSPKIKGKKEIKIESELKLKIDNRYYYRLNVKKDKISVMCLAFDACEEIFELVSKSPYALAEKLNQLNRFKDYEMDILHRIDIGTQLGKAAMAAKLGYFFIQDFNTLFKLNIKNLPLVVSEGDSFLNVHKNILTKIYTEGLTEPHADEWKGIARTAVALAVYRNSKNSLKNMPMIYKLGDQDTDSMRAVYKAQLLRFDSDGSYSYGERTRRFFGFDQLEETIKILKNNPAKAAIIQRFDPIEDMSVRIEDGKEKYSHDPCLTHDIYLISGNKLHSFHIARAHNAVNAYPENIFGLYDAYVSTVREKLGLEGGDMYMLSNRANILLLTEEQRMKKILAEPSKPNDTLNNESGPYQLAENIKLPSKNISGVAYLHIKAKKINKRPNSKILENLENYNNINVLEKAINYLNSRGVVHNNPIISEYMAGRDDPQGEYLVFFQANVFGKKAHATAVFANRSIKNKKVDIDLCNYLITQYSKKLDIPLGNITIFYVGF